ncbi:MAG TPA: hypothetical protein VLS89_12785 [Candidatus Nanopelagicales bacterium]|nr:hypothetical protein [Candidatus Nanopelagicales bacterium]
MKYLGAAGLLATAAACSSRDEAPPLPAVPQAAPQGFFDGPFIGRPSRLGTCDEAETRAGYEVIDRQWAAYKDRMERHVACLHVHGAPLARFNDPLLTAHLLRGLVPHGCLGGSGSAGQDSECGYFNGYAQDLTNRLEVSLRTDIVTHDVEELTPDLIFIRALEVTDNNVPLALWISYRLTNQMSGGSAVSEYGALLDRMPNLRSPCSPISGPSQIGGNYYHFFLVAQISYDYGLALGWGAHVVERAASFRSAVGDPDKSSANYHGMGIARRLLEVEGLGRSSSQCAVTYADDVTVTIGQTKEVDLGTNDTVIPRSLRTRTPPEFETLIERVPASLTVQPMDEPLAKASLSSSGPPGSHRFHYSLLAGGLRSNTSPVRVTITCPPGTTWNGSACMTDGACSDAGMPSPPPPFAGTACPTAGAGIDYASLDQELLTYQKPDRLTFGMKLEPYAMGQCDPISTLELPVPCGGHQDYQIWKMGGAASFNAILPNSTYWVWNPHYIAEGMWDQYGLFDGEPITLLSYAQQNNPLVPCNDARGDLMHGPVGPIIAGSEHPSMIRAYPVYQRAAADPGLPASHALCYDLFRVQPGNGLVPCSATTGQGALYLVLQPRQVVCP